MFRIGASNVRKSCYYVSMSSEGPKKRGDESAREWASERAALFGEAVGFWRKKIDLTMVELSNRTKEIGYPITRATIAKIESNQRNAKVDFAEVVTLATALEVAPSDLVFFGYPSRELRVVPRVYMASNEAIDWFNGTESYSPYDELSKPRITQSWKKKQPISEYEKAIESFEVSYRPKIVLKDYYIDEIPQKMRDRSKDGELVGFDTYMLRARYEEIRRLRAEVIDAGGDVQLPGWIDCFKVAPF